MFFMVGLLLFRALRLTTGHKEESVRAVLSLFLTSEALAMPDTVERTTTSLTLNGKLYRQPYRGRHRAISTIYEASTAALFLTVRENLRDSGGQE